MKPWSFLFLAFVGFAAIMLTTSASLATDTPAPSETPPQTTRSPADSGAVAPVVVDGRSIFLIRTSVGGYSAKERAANITQQILAVARDTSIPVDAVQPKTREAWSEILAGNQRILVITEEDAQAADRARADLTLETAEIIRVTIRRYREEHTWKNILYGIGNSILATLALFTILWVVWRVHKWLSSKIEEWFTETQDAPPTFPAWRLVKSYAIGALFTIGVVIRWGIALLLLNVYLTFILYEFPQTRQLSLETTNWFFSKLSLLGNAFLDYVPNLIVVAIIVLVVRFVVRANSLFFKEIRNENLKIKGFDPDWAIPTSNLVRLLIIAMALVILFPYLPGAESPAVKGIGLFAGLLLSLGSSSAIANAVAGTILTYTRAFRIGDVVQMGESFGTVSDKTLFVTRIRTPKNVTISLPNGSVLGNSITNYSVAARNKSLILHTTVSIGYDTPWRQVEAMLLRAAQRSTHVLQEPRPFVLRKELADFYINYELNTYCDEPDDIPGVYSELHDNILDAFNEFGVQIMSPHYMADRSEKTWVPKDRWFMAPAAPSHPHEQKNSASGQDEARSRQGK